MSGINSGRVMVGGIAAAVVIGAVEGIGSTLYTEDLTGLLGQHGIVLDMTATGPAVSGLLTSLIAGISIVYLYALARPRLGPGPRSAIRIGTVMWVAAYITQLLGWNMLGIFPMGMLALWGAIGLVEMVLAALVGAWIYKE